MTLYQRTFYIFKKINPIKRFSSFSYTEITIGEMNLFYCNKGEILKIGNDYYLYNGESEFNTSNPIIQSKILFKQGNKIVYEILP